MGRWETFAIVLVLISSFVSNAQPIRKSSSPKEVKLFLKAKKADKVVFSASHEDIYQLRNKKTHKWGMFDWYNQLIPMEYDTIIPFKQFQPFTIARKAGHYVVIFWPYDTETFRFINGNQFENMEIITLHGVDFNSHYFLVACKKGKWGCLDWQDLSTLIPFCYANATAVPLTTISSHSKF